VTDIVFETHHSSSSSSRVVYDIRPLQVVVFCYTDVFNKLFDSGLNVHPVCGSNNVSDCSPWMSYTVSHKFYCYLPLPVKRQDRLTS